MSGDIIDLSSPHWATGGMLAGCTGQSNQSSDKCTWDVTMSCPAKLTPQVQAVCDGAISTSKITGTPPPSICTGTPLLTIRSSTKWLPDLKAATATLSWKVESTGADCSSLYLATIF